MVFNIEAPGFLRNNTPPETFKSVAVIGGEKGQTGKLFVSTLSPVLPTFSVGRGGIESALEMEPEAVLLAVQNPACEALEEVANYIQRPLTLILPQNGIGVVGEAEKILKSTRNKITIVRASLSTIVSSDDQGNIIFDPNKKRIAFASVGETSQEEVSKVGNMFARAGFDVRVRPDYRSMEWTKLLLNLVGSTSVVTGLSPREAFSDPEILALELRGLKDRLGILEKAGIPIDDGLWDIIKLWILANTPEPLVLSLKEPIADRFAAERNNQPPAAAREIQKGAKSVESEVYYHAPMVNLGLKNKLGDPVDEAIIDVLQGHRQKEGFSLTDIDPQERKRLLLKAYDCERKQVFVPAFFPVQLAADFIFDRYADKFIVKGKENLNAVAECLKAGKCVLVASNHRSHVDSEVVMKALRESLPEDVRDFPVNIVANTKFNNERISGALSQAYSHLVVYKLEPGDSEETKWQARIINKNAGRVLKGLLKKPCIFIVYLEGGRSKFYKDGRPQLLPPAIGSYRWVVNPKFGLVLPIVITGTEKIMPPGEQWPVHGEATIEFLPAIETESLRKETVRVPKEQRNKFSSEVILGKIAERLPVSERGVYAS